MAAKECEHCGKVLEMHDAWGYFCGSCHELLSAYEKRKYTFRRYHKRHKEKCNKISRDYHKSRYEGDPDYYKGKHLKALYGITLDDWNTMYEAQNGCCYICGKHSSEHGKGLAVDHDHQTGEVRKLLCPYCNVVLGRAFDSIERLEQCI